MKYDQRSTTFIALVIYNTHCRIFPPLDASKAVRNCKVAVLT